MKSNLHNAIIKIKFLGKNKGILIDIEKYTKEETLLDKIASILINFPSIVILNGQNISDKKFVEIGRKVKLLCAEFESTLIIMHRTDIAVTIEADGLLLGEEDISSNDAKDIVGQDLLIGLFTNNNQEDSDFYIENNILKSKYTEEFIQLENLN